MIWLLFSQISEIQNKYLNLKYLKADFTQTIKNPDGNSISYSGYLIYSAPNELKFFIKNPTEQTIVIRDSLMITILGSDSQIQVLPKDFIFNPYYFLKEGFKVYKSGVKSDGNKIFVNLTSENLFYKSIQFTFQKNDYKLLNILAYDSYGNEYEMKLFNIFER